jgi:hypothetical protein
MSTTTWHYHLQTMIMSFAKSRAPSMLSPSPCPLRLLLARKMSSSLAGSRTHPIVQYKMDGEQPDYHSPLSVSRRSHMWQMISLIITMQTMIIEVCDVNKINTSASFDQINKHITVRITNSSHVILDHCKHELTWIKLRTVGR